MVFSVKWRHLWRLSQRRHCGICQQPKGLCLSSDWYPYPFYTLYAPGPYQYNWFNNENFDLQGEMKPIMTSSPKNRPQKFLIFKSFFKIIVWSMSIAFYTPCVPWLVQYNWFNNKFLLFQGKMMPFMTSYLKIVPKYF